MFRRPDVGEVACVIDSLSKLLDENILEVCVAEGWGIWDKDDIVLDCVIAVL